MPDPWEAGSTVVTAPPRGRDPWDDGPEIRDPWDEEPAKLEIPYYLARPEAQPAADSLPVRINPNLARRPNAAERRARATPTSLSEIASGFAGMEGLPFDKLIPSDEMLTKTGLPKAGIGFLKGTAALAKGLTSPMNAALLGATAGAGAIPVVGKTAVQLASAYFAQELLKSGAAELPEVKEALDSGDPEKIVEVGTLFLGTLGMGTAAGAHGFKGQGIPIRRGTPTAVSEAPRPQSAQAGDVLDTAIETPEAPGSPAKSAQDLRTARTAAVPESPSGIRTANGPWLDFQESNAAETAPRAAAESSRPIDTSGTSPRSEARVSDIREAAPSSEIAPTVESVPRETLPGQDTTPQVMKAENAGLPPRYSIRPDPFGKPYGLYRDDVWIGSATTYEVAADQARKIADSGKLTAQSEIPGVRPDVPVAAGEPAQPIQANISKLALGVQEKAIANKLTTGFEGLPEYKMVNVADQAKRSAELLKSDPQLAINVAMGNILPPEGVLPESIFVAVENYATETSNVALLRDLATSSGLTTQATGMGQRIRMLAERNPDSAVASIQDVQAARESAATRRFGTKMKQQVQNEIVKARDTAAPKMGDWMKFVDSLKC